MSVPTPLVYYNLQNDSTEAVAGVLNGTDTSMTYSSAAQFSGSGYITIADSPTIEPTTAITIMTRLKLTNTSTSFQMALAKGENGGDTQSYELRCFGTTSRMEIQMKNTGGNTFQARTTNSIGTGAFKWVTYTWDGTTQKMYIDGVLETLASDVNPGGTIRYGADSLWLGQRNGGLRLQGEQEYFGLWDVALSSAEINEVIANPSYPFPAGNNSNFLAFM